MWENDIPTALIHEMDAEAAFNGVPKLKATLRRKCPVWQIFNFLMHGKLAQKFRKKSSPRKSREKTHRPWMDIDVCIQCAIERKDWISVVTMMQVRVVGISLHYLC